MGRLRAIALTLFLEGGVWWLWGLVGCIVATMLAAGICSLAAVMLAGECDAVELRRTGEIGDK